MDDSQDLKKELQELRMLLEIEKQKAAKAQKELELALKKSGQIKPVAPIMAKGTAPKAVSSGPQIEMGDIPLTTDELNRLQSVCTETQKKLESIEQEKWVVQKKNIELKEGLQRLKVQGANHRKDIETYQEKLDRKENQNFKVRLELTDLRKELAGVKDEQEAQEKTLRKLEKQIEEVVVQNSKLDNQLKEEQKKRDRINLEYNKARDLLAQYEDHWMRKLYLK
jgi:septal ring factor EnvC (AmiA/AmiB activator)